MVREDFHVLCKDYELSFVPVEFAIACLSITANSTIAKGRPYTPKKKKAKFITPTNYHSPCGIEPGQQGSCLLQQGSSAPIIGLNPKVSQIGASLGQFLFVWGTYHLGSSMLRLRGRLRGILGDNMNGT
jgi:hypothetical protein